MPIFRFHIREGKFSNSPGRELELPDHRALWTEATGLCNDISRHIIEDFEQTPDWSLEVTDSHGRTVFRFRFVAETFI
jgi:hypothetical protein